MLVSFNNGNVIKLTNKNKTSEDFDDVNKVVLFGISDNIASLVQSVEYGDINTDKSTTMAY